MCNLQNPLRALLKYNWHVINYTWLMCIIRSILTYLCTCKTITITKMVNICFIPKRFLIPLSIFYPLLLTHFFSTTSNLLYYTVHKIFKINTDINTLLLASLLNVLIWGLSVLLHVSLVHSFYTWVIFHCTGISQCTCHFIMDI